MTDVGLRLIAAALAIGRNPEMSGTLTTTMFIGIAFSEALAIFGLVISFMIGFKIF